MFGLATTTITIYREPLTTDQDFYDPQDPTVWRSGVGASIQAPSGQRFFTDGAKTVTGLKLLCDIDAGLQNNDTIKDEATGIFYDVLWTTDRIGVGLDHTIAGIQITTGEASV